MKDVRPILPRHRQLLDDSFPEKTITYTVMRDVTMQECRWLNADVPAGTKVYRWTGPTYGCISDEGIAVTLVRGREPFLELPRRALHVA